MSAHFSEPLPLKLSFLPSKFGDFWPTRPPPLRRRCLWMFPNVFIEFLPRGCAWGWSCDLLAHSAQTACAAWNCRCCIPAKVNNRKKAVRTSLLQLTFNSSYDYGTSCFVYEICVFVCLYVCLFVCFSGQQDLCHLKLSLHSCQS